MYGAYFSQYKVSQCMSFIREMCSGKRIRQSHANERHILPIKFAVDKNPNGSFDSYESGSLCEFRRDIHEGSSLIQTSAVRACLRMGDVEQANRSHHQQSVCMRIVV